MYDFVSIFKYYSNYEYIWNWGNKKWIIILFDFNNTEEEKEKSKIMIIKNWDNKCIRFMSKNYWNNEYFFYMLF